MMYFIRHQAPPPGLPYGAGPLPYPAGLKAGVPLPGLPGYPGLPYGPSPYPAPGHGLGPLLGHGVSPYGPYAGPFGYPYGFH